MRKSVNSSLLFTYIYDLIYYMEIASLCSYKCDALQYINKIIMTLTHTRHANINNIIIYCVMQEERKRMTMRRGENPDLVYEFFEEVSNHAIAAAN